MSTRLRPGYKQTEVGVIPENWAVKPLGSVLNRGRLGGNYPNQAHESRYPLMKMGNIARGYIDHSKVEYVTEGITPLPDDRLRPGDVLFNTRNTLDLVGKVAIWRNELPVAYYNSNLMRLEFDPSSVCSNEYANYALNSSAGVARLKALATGTTSVAAIYTRDLFKLPFVVPPLPEQRAIAEALGNVDALLGALTQLIAKKRDLKQASMQQLLTGHQRLPGFSGEWEVKQLGDIASVTAGGTPSRTNPRYWNGNVPWVTTSEVDWCMVNSAEQFITKEGLRNSAAKLHPPGTLLMALYGQGKTRGKVAVLGIEASTNQACAAIDFNRDLCKEFLFYFLVNQYDAIRNLSNTGNQENLNGSIVRSISILLPPLPEQTAIAAVLSDMDAEIAVLEQRLAKTRALKQGMMQELLTGRTRLV